MTRNRRFSLALGILVIVLLVGAAWAVAAAPNPTTVIDRPILTRHSRLVFTTHDRPMFTTQRRPVFTRVAS